MHPFFILTITQVVFENVERAGIFQQARARALESGKPLLNAGCGELKTVGGFPRAILESDVNLDLVAQDVPRFTQAPIEDIPFPDKHFGAVFCCHALEHVDDLDLAIRELDRVADHVFVVVPRAVWPSSWLHPGHKRVFAGDRIVEKSESGWRIGGHFPIQGSS